MAAVQLDVLKDNMEFPTESGYSEKHIRKLRNLRKMCVCFVLSKLLCINFTQSNLGAKAE